MPAFTDQQLQLATIAVSVALAFVGYFVTYTNSLRLKRLDAQFEFVTEQLSRLYGPLYALTQSNSRTWETFTRVFRPGRSIFNDPDDKLSEEEVREWVRWVTYVFQPSNRRMKVIIEQNAHLFSHNEMPACALDFMAHAETFELLVENWKAGDYSKLFTPIVYPKALDAYVEGEYRRISKLHASLSGRRQGKRVRHAPSRKEDEARRHIEAYRNQTLKTRP